MSFTSFFCDVSFPNYCSHEACHKAHSPFPAGVRSNPDERGVIPNSFEHIFTHIDRTENEKYLVRVSYLEIYQEEIRDLLSKDHKSRLELREKPDTGVYVKV